KPAAHRVLGLSLAPGVSELLREEASLAEVIRPTQIDGLSLLSAGLYDALALQALAQDALREPFVRVREQYQFIVVDSCPVLPVADALLIAQHVDAVLFSVLREVSEMPKIYNAYQRLAVLGVRMLGAVVSGTQSDTYGSDYHYAGQRTP